MPATTLIGDSGVAGETAFDLNLVPNPGRARRSGWRRRSAGCKKGSTGSPFPESGPL